MDVNFIVIGIEGKPQRVLSTWTWDDGKGNVRTVDDFEHYCAKCSKIILKPNVNYGINPDAVCRCSY